MEQPHGLVRRIAWHEVFPWLILLRVFRIAIAPTLLALATVAVLLMPLGWWIGGRLFLSDQQRMALATTNDAMPGANDSNLQKEVPAAPRVYFPTATTAL